jgi:hypothetical protein
MWLANRLFRGDEVVHSVVADMAVVADEPSKLPLGLALTVRYKQKRIYEREKH